MEINNLFERATREKTRFNFKGSISVEELWDLSLINLDTIYGNLESELERLPKKSLLEINSDQREGIEFKQEIIKHIVEVKKKEQKLAEESVINAHKKKMLLDIIAEKQNESYKNMSLEDLQSMVEKL